ncbi:tetratricopeptide repeat protein [Burkholderia plantarii]|uniref:TPR domain protein n=1 Tax=Burkholderia plantarii TaxID=41899 RepID=A0A0B6SCR9_BURPL|nr:tetratricopeptide repeat protein [Burkholderia plantarii]AJK50056.1 TPR domain protein [Burkholderia plantarii]
MSRTVPQAAPAGVSAPLRAALDDALRNARGCVERRDFAGARRLYEGVLAMAPDHVEAMHLLGVVLLQLHDPARAEPLLARSLQLGLSLPWAVANHAAALAGIGRHDEALALAGRALAGEPANPVAHAARGDALAGLARYLDAAAAYERTLAREPGNARAWQRRADALRRGGRPADALISIGQALQLMPNDATAHVIRGDALRALGRPAEALHSYQLAVVVRGKTPDLVHACGMAMIESGRPAEALVWFDEGLARAPDDAMLLFASCIALDLMHAHADLLARCDRLLALSRDSGPAWLGRGNALLGLERHEEAEQAYAEALARLPDSVDALRNRAAALRALGRPAEALDHFDRALALAGPQPELLYQRALTLQLLGRYDDALASHAAGAEAPADTARALFTRALTRQHMGRHDAALADLLLARERDPYLGEALRTEAFCRLLTGDYALGWARHEARWQAADTLRDRRYAERPAWTGEASLAGRSILLHAEQGYGDVLQFCRYASVVSELGATVYVEVPAPLVELLGTLRGVSRVVDDGQSLPGFDFQCPLMSLPYAFRTTIETVPAAVPYLRADPARRAAWAARLDAVAAPGRPRVGLAWSGNPRHANDLNRSIPFAMLAPWIAASGASVVSLQQAVRPRDAEAFAASGVASFGEALESFADTAALVEALDLVISVDTSIAHLAGALGRPLWVLLPRVPDWRWLLDRDDSPWYPGATLFRQDRPGDWPAVIERVAAALAGRAWPVAGAF